MLNDFRHGVRLLFKNPAFALTAILVVALGIGANTSIFSVVNAVLLRPLPYAEPEQLVFLWGNVQRVVVERRGTSFPDFFDWRERSRSFEGMAAHLTWNLKLAGTDEPERLQVEVVSASYFPLLRLGAQVGRVFRPEEDAKPDAGKVAVISAALWKRRFGSDPGVLEKSLRLDNGVYTVIGVAPEGFRGLSDSADLWIPVMSSGMGEMLTSRASRGFPALARLKRGVSREQAQSEMDAIARQLEQEYPQANEKRGVEVAPLAGEFFGDIKPALLVIMAAVGFVLLIACANVANLMLARAEVRQKEMAVRAALGAGRLRLFRQLTAESLVLAVVGGGLGMLLSLWGTEALMTSSPVEFPSFVKPGIDPTVALFSVLMTLATGLVMGLAPAVSASESALQSALRESSGRSSSGRARQRFRGALVVVEVAVAVVLLVGAGLFMRSFQKLLSLDPGFRPEGLLSFDVSLPLPENPAPGQEPAALVARRIREGLKALSGVVEVGLASDLPLSGNENAMFYTAEGQPSVDARNMPRAYFHRVAPGYFQAIGIRRLNGRDFTPEEMDVTRNVVIVSEAVARRFWPGQNAIGRRVRGGRPASQAPWLEIVGVVDEVKYRGLPRNPTPDPDLYFPFNERARDFSVVLRTSGDPASLAPAVRNELRNLERSAVVFNMRPMTERVSRQMARSRFTSWLMGIFACAAIALAMIGIYGVMAHSVEQRTREIGIRMALGAARRDVLRMVAVQGMALVGAGVVLGIAGVLGLTGLVRTLLYGVEPTDPVVFAAVPALLAGAAMLAAWLPARRATRVDPMVALRYE